MQDAHLLKNALEDAGIQAMVTNEVLQGGSGVDIVGWPTSCRVMVAEDDALKARQIALEFDRRISDGFREQEPLSEQDGEETEVIDQWPLCPSCGKRRLTRCPICNTAGTDFPPGHQNTADFLGLPETSDDALSSCSCGPGGCGKPGIAVADVSSVTGEAEENDEVASASETSSENLLSPILICPTCDEPFHPQYLRRCEWCGHEFTDGQENPVEEEPVQEPFNWRIAYILYILALLMIGLGGYLLWLF